MDREAVDEVKRAVAEVVAEVGARVDRRQGHLEESMREQFADMRRHVDAAVEENRRHFGVIADSLRAEVRLVAESVSRLAQTAEARSAMVAEELGEIKAMIRLSYRELDSRLRTLESDVSELRTRLERVENRLGN